jgi:hypothetical protein
VEGTWLVRCFKINIGEKRFHPQARGFKLRHPPILERTGVGVEIALKGVFSGRIDRLRKRKLNQKRD